MKGKQITIMFIALLVPAIVFAGGSKEAPKEAKPISLKYAHVGVATEIQTRYADEVAEAVKQRTNGRLVIQVFPNSQLGGVSEMVDGVKAGSIDMGHHDFASLGKFLTDISVFNAPYIYRDAEHAIKATNPKTSPILQEINEKLIAAAGIRVIGSLYRGARQLSANFPVYSPADLKGKKIRGVPLQLWMTMIQGMGAIPTPVEIAELHTALMTGVVAGQENPLQNIYAQKFYEVQTHIMMTNHMHSVLCTFINEKSWQRIPEAERAIFEQVLQDKAMESLKWTAEADKDIRAKLEEKGMKFIDESNGLKVEEFRSAVLAKVYQDFPQWKAYIEKIQLIK
jgi:tripartite ATP-independent transporter DctP family solute receptor